MKELPHIKIIMVSLKSLMGQLTLALEEVVTPSIPHAVAENIAVISDWT
jgi:hypothetical protein